MGFIEISHKTTGGVAVVVEEALPLYEDRGWKRTDPKADPVDSPGELADPLPTPTTAKSATAKEA